LNEFLISSTCAEYQNTQTVTFEVHTAVKTVVFVSWAVTTCGLAGRHQRSESIDYPHLQP
jgi:hypothetical protein